jgi:Domain of unknown function (DUF4145)
MHMQNTVTTVDFRKQNPRLWATYACKHCGGVVLAVGDTASGVTEKSVIAEMWPQQETVSEAVPQPAKDYLTQAMESLHAPSGAVLLCGSAVDAMLKAKGFKDGTLNSRIDFAAKQHAITSDMAAWAHEIRLDANDQRHADENAALPLVEDAERAIEFANALAQFLFVLPARVKRGRVTS